MDTRYFYKEFMVLLILLSFSSGCSNSVSKQDHVLPNIVIIYADDMGYGDLACQNPGSKIPTPNLDSLAQQGMRFTDAHSTSGVCSPSRYSLLTGRYHWRGYLKTGIVNIWGDPAIESGRLTIASMLKDKDYLTACIGKWHLGWTWPFNPGLGQNDTSVFGWHDTYSKNGSRIFNPEDFNWSKPIQGGPTSCGFDYYFGDGTINFPPYVWIENDRVLQIPDTLLNLGVEETAEGSWECRPGPMVSGWNIRSVPLKLTEKAVEWIEKQKNTRKPFFLYFALPSPHAPIIPAEQFSGKTEAGGYGDYMYQTDWMVGQVLDALYNNGFRKNTLVIFTSDNGPERYAYNRIRNYDHFSMGKWRGLKRDLWEGGHRVPFLIRYPGTVPAGKISDEVICQTDVMASIAALVGYDIPEKSAEDSYNMLDIFKGKKSMNRIRDASIHHSPRGDFAIRKGDWVLIDSKSGEVSKEPDWLKNQRGYVVDSTPIVLYNLVQNPEEKVNLYHDYPEKVKELKELLEKYKEIGRSTPFQ